MEVFMQEKVRIVNNVTKFYPDMIKVTIYKQPLIFTKRDVDKRPRELVPDSYEPSISSLSRTKTLVSDIVLCNDFRWFVTFTFDPQKVDSFNYNACLHVLSRWLHHQKDLCPDMSYLVIPEQHKSGRWHFHAVISQFNGSMRDSNHTTSTGRRIYNVTCFRSGFTTAVEIDNRTAVSNYITKYITKDLIHQFNRRRFIASKNLKRPVREVNSRTFELSLPIFRHKYYESEQYDCYSLDLF